MGISLYLHSICQRPRDIAGGKSLVLSDLASVLQNRKSRGEISSQLATSAVIQSVSTRTTTLKAVIDSGSPFDLISQMKIKEMQLVDGEQPKQKPRGIDGHLQSKMSYNAVEFSRDVWDMHI